MAGRRDSGPEGEVRGIIRAASGDFRRAPSHGSVTFDERAAKGEDNDNGLVRVPSKSGSMGSQRKGSKIAIPREASGISRASSGAKGGGIARGGSAGWAKLRAVAALTKQSVDEGRASEGTFSRLPSSMVRVPSANAPGSLGIVVPLSLAKTLTQEESIKQSRKDIKQWKEEQSVTQLREAVLQCTFCSLLYTDLRSLAGGTAGKDRKFE